MIPTTTTKDRFLAQIHSDRAVWDNLVASIPDERLSEPGAIGHWSVKDTIAHIAFYERWTIEWLEPALDGNPPDWDYPNGEDTLGLDDRNARIFEQNRQRTLGDIRAQAAHIHARLVSLLERLPEAAFAQNIQDFAPEVGLYYDAGTTVTTAIDANTAAHYRDHTHDVRRWLAG